MVRLESEGQRREVWENKKELSGRKERIVEDLTWGGGKKNEMEVGGNCEGGREKRKECGEEMGSYKAV